jgi:hypothetical protein
MQNKPNLEIDPMVVTKVLTTDYDKRTLGGRGKNKPKQTQNKPNRKKAKNAPTSLLLTTNDQRLTTREAQNKPNQSQCVFIAAPDRDSSGFVINKVQWRFLLTPSVWPHTMLL